MHNIKCYLEVQTHTTAANKQGPGKVGTTRLCRAAHLVHTNTLVLQWPNQLAVHLERRQDS